jgi:hypothetical protein
VADPGEVGQGTDRHRPAEDHRTRHREHPEGGSAPATQSTPSTTTATTVATGTIHRWPTTSMTNRRPNTLFHTVSPVSSLGPRPTHSNSPSAAVRPALTATRRARWSPRGVSSATAPVATSSGTNASL